MRLALCSSIAVLSAATAAAQDDCSTPIPIAGLGAYALDNTAATTSGFIEGACGSAIGPAGGFNDVFYAWTATSAGDYLFQTCGSGSDLVVDIYLGGDCSATCAVPGGDLDNCPNALDESKPLNGAIAGQVYLIQVGGWFNTVATVSGAVLNVATGSPIPTNDTCSTPDPLSGFGPTLFDTTSATNSGFDGNGFPPCGGNSLNTDLFWVWTAGATGFVDFDTIGSSFDTRLSVHDGSGCLSTCLAYNDNGIGIGTDSSVTVSVTSGANYLVQVGAWGAAVGAGQLNITTAAVPMPPANDTCATPEVIAGEGTFAWNNVDATTTTFNGGEISLIGAPNCYATGGDSDVAGDVFFVWTVPCDGNYVFDTYGSTVPDTKLNLHFGADCSAACMEGNDDDTPSFFSLITLVGASAGETYLIQTGGFAVATPEGDGLLNIARVGGGCASVSIAASCDPANAHYQGGSVTLATSSFGSGVGSDLHLEATDGPVDEFGFFLVSADASGSLAVFNGVLCLVNPTARYNPQVATNTGNSALNSIGQFDAGGVLQNLSGTSATGSGFDVPSQLPFTPGVQTVLPGETWFFQLWYRDQVAPLPNPGSSANFSNVAEVTFP